MQLQGITIHRWSPPRLAFALFAVVWLQGGTRTVPEARSAPSVADEARCEVDRATGPPALAERPSSMTREDADPFLRIEGNPFVAAWRARLARTPPRLLDAYLARPATLEHELGPILDAHGVPREFLYLALVESGMDAEAISPAAAVGLWQFRDATARQYGLIVSEHMDERMDERRATQAAGRYLRDLYDQFGSWELAAAAYNAGPGRVRRALDATGARTYWDLLASGHLPAETRAYVPKFLAVVGLAAERAGPAGPIVAD